jgi:hypothetical protein
VAKARPPTISWLPWWLRGPVGRWALRSVALLLVVAGFLAGVIWLGRWGQEQIHDQERYLVPFADVECDTPEGMERRVFLEEVEYHARPPLPDPVNVLDADLPDRLRAAFARHPWVEKVDGVTLTPPRHVAVRLTFRVPVLAVRWGNELRAVDGDGVLLPKNAPTRELAIYDGTPRRPRGPPGTHWGDSDLERAARKRRPAKQ